MCLRPDLLLCTEAWKLIAIVNDISISFIDIISLLYANEEVLKSTIVPECVMELSSIIHETESFDLFDLSPIFILNMRNRRQCTSHRAEAIMSAIEVTE